MLQIIPALPIRHVMAAEEARAAELGVGLAVAGDDDAGGGVAEATVGAEIRVVVGYFLHRRRFLFAKAEW